MAYTPTLADIPLDTQQTASQTPQQNTGGYTPSLADIPQDSLATVGSGMAKAALGGIGQGLVKAGSDLGGLVKEGIQNIAPAPVSQAIGKGLDTLGGPVSQALTASPQSQIGQAMQQNPDSAQIGNTIGQIAPYAIPGSVAGKATNTILGMVAGAAQAKPGVVNRAEGAAIGGLITRGAYALQGVLQAGVSALRAPGIVKAIGEATDAAVQTITSTFSGTPAEIGAKGAATVYQATKEVDDQLFSAFRKPEMSFDHDMYQVKRQAEDLLDAHSDILDGVQKQALQKVSNLASADSTIAQMHDIRKTLGRAYGAFSPKNGAIASDAYNNLKYMVNQKLPEMADRAGVLNEFNAANDHYQTKMLPLENAGVGDLADALSSQGLKTDPVQAGKMLDHWVDNNIKGNSPNQVKALLNTLDDHTRDAIETRTLQGIMDKARVSSAPAAAVKTSLNKLGDTADQLFTGQNKVMIQGAKNVLNEASPIMNLKAAKGSLTGQFEAPVLQAISSAASTPEGRVVLRMMGEPGITKSVIASFLRQGAVFTAGQLKNIYTDSSSTNGENNVSP